MSKEAFAPARIKEVPKEEPKNPADLEQDWTFSHLDKKKEVKSADLEQDWTFSHLDKKSGETEVVKPEAKKNTRLETMTFQDMEEPGSPYEKLLQFNALKYLQTNDKEFFKNNFTGELDQDGYLIPKDGSKPTTKPSMNIGGGLPMMEVERMVRNDVMGVVTEEPVVEVKAQPVKRKRKPKPAVPESVQPIAEIQSEPISPEAISNPEGRIIWGSTVMHNGEEWILKDYSGTTGKVNLVKKLPKGVQPGEGDITQISQKELYRENGSAPTTQQETPMTNTEPEKQVVDLENMIVPEDRFVPGDEVWHNGEIWELEGYDMNSGEALIKKQDEEITAKISQGQLYSENPIQKTYDTEYGPYTEYEMKASQKAYQKKKAEKIKAMEAETREKVLERDEKISVLKQKIGRLAERQQKEMDRAQDDTSKQAVADRYKKYQGNHEREMIKQKTATAATKSKGFAKKWFEKLFS